MIRDHQNNFPMVELGETMTMLQYLIDMGARGNHVLFDPEVIRRAFSRQVDDLVDVDPDTVTEVNKAIKRIIELQDIEEKKDYIHDLNPQLQDIIVHLYFQMIDRSIVQSSRPMH